MDQLKQYLKGTNYNLLNATYFNIHEIQECLKQCRINDNLIVFVEKCNDSQGFFDRLAYFNLDSQESNYYIAHSRNYAVWIDPSELKRDVLLTFLNESKSQVSVDEGFFESDSSYKTERIV